MTVRAFAAAVLVGTVAIYAWQTISNAALPWHRMTMRELAGSDSLVRQIRAAAPANGTYYAKQGILAAIDMTSGFADRTSATAIKPMLLRQVGIDVVMAIALLIVVSRIALATPVRTGMILAVAGFAAGVAQQFSDWNWYGFGASYAMVNVVDVAIQCFIGGFAISAFLNRFGARAVTEERVGVPAPRGYQMPSSGHPTGTR